MPPDSLPIRNGVNHWIACSTISTRPEIEPSPSPGDASIRLDLQKKVVAVLDRVLSGGEFPDRQSAGSRVQRDAGQQIASAEQGSRHMRIVYDAEALQSERDRTPLIQPANVRLQSEPRP